MNKALLATIAGTLALMITFGAGTASAAPVTVVTSGACSGSSTWLLTLKLDNGRIEADSEIQSRASGQTWRSRFSDNGITFGWARKVTLADGSTSATRYAVNQAGSDVITIQSTNLATQEVCTATATF